VAHQKISEERMRSSMKGTVSRITVGVFVAAALMALVAVPAGAAPVPLKAPKVQIANPAPGDYLRRGGNWVGGVACDPDAPLTEDTAGISRVDLFLGDRDTTIGAPSFRPGGFYGRATAAGLRVDFSSNAASSSRLGIPSPDFSTCKQTYSAFRLLPSSFRRGVWDLNVYVIAKNGMETKLTIAGLRIDRP
jgi:hypothetical protein